MPDETERAARRRLERRVAWLVTGVTLALLLLALRLVQLQIVRGPDLARQAVAQRTVALPLALGRGTIYDRNLRPLHAPVVSWRLVAYAPQVDDPAGLSRRLSELLGLDSGRIDETLRRAEGFVVLADGLTDRQAAVLGDWQPAGLTVVQHEERYGPGAVAAHVVGYVQRTDNAGVAGLEKTFDDLLRGREARTLLVLLDAYRRPIEGFRIVRSGAPEAGHDLVTTIDWRLQRHVEDALARTGRPASAVVVDAHTGDVLAMASHPTFDASRLADYLDRDQDQPLINRALAAYPPGSVFKVVTAAAALEAGLVEGRTFPCRGFIDVGPHRFPSQCPEGAPERISWEAAMAVSSNEVFIRIGLDLGAEALVAGARSYGFGRPTGLPLPEEMGGHVPNPGEVRFAGDLANLAIGQGPLTVTPVQVAQFLTALVNNGELQPLRLVSEVRRADGVLVRDFPPAPRRRVFSAGTAAALRRALRLVVREGTGARAEVPVLGAAGKTGSAETGRTLPGGATLSHAWFAGYVPATLPRYVIVVFVEGGQSGPQVAAPLFREIAEELFNP